MVFERYQVELTHRVASSRGSEAGLEDSNFTHH